MSRDQQLAGDVKAELEWDPQVDADHIGVNVEDGAVTLSGIASTYAEKWAAGVSTVDNQIAVRP